MIRPELPLFGLALVALLGCVLLLALGKDVPGFLSTVVLSAVVGGAGIATPRTPPAPPGPPAALVDGGTAP